MTLECKLIEKSFTDKEGQSHKYNCLQFELSDGSTLEITVKGDKAKLLRLSNQKPDDEFWHKIS